MTHKLVLVALGAWAATSAIADTIAWYHFDEQPSGTTVSTDYTVKNACLNDSSVKTKARATDGTNWSGPADYKPKYASSAYSPSGWISDPVAGQVIRNWAAMGFTTGPLEDGTKFGYYGGTLLIESGASDGKDPTVWPTDALTVECFVKTTQTKDDFDTFAPIFGKLTSTGSSPYGNEAFALYMCVNGGISCRICTGTKAPESNTATGKGTAINDGRWHHVALVFSQSAGCVKGYVDYEEAFSRPTYGALNYDYKSGSTAASFPKAFLIGGYPYMGSAKGRKFNGTIDELRVSNVALPTSKFLRFKVKTADADTVLRMRLDEGSAGWPVSDSLNLNETGSTVCKYTTQTGADAPTFSTDEHAAATVRESVYAGDSAANPGSISFTTNGVGQSGYLKASGITSAMNDKWTEKNWATNVSYTVELAFKARQAVTDATGQILFQISSSQTCGAWLRTYNGKPTLTFLSNGKGEKKYYNWAAERVDDGQWHRVAVVNDAEKNRSFFYVDGQLAMASAVNFDNPMDKGSSLWVGCGYDNGVKKFFDGWIDDVRVTKRALQPDEFLNAQATAAESEKTLALFNFEDSYASDVNAGAVGPTFGAQHTSDGAATAFDAWPRGGLYFEGTNEDQSVTANTKWLRFADSVWGLERHSPLFEQKSFTVEFFGKFPNTVGSAGLVGYVPGVADEFKTGTSPIWKLYRDGSKNQLKLRLVIADAESSHEPTYPVFDLTGAGSLAGLHHYALVFDQTSEPGKLKIALYVDYATREDWQYEFDGYLDYAGAADGFCAGRLCVGQGGTANKLSGWIDALRFTRGVLDSGAFIRREKLGVALFLR